MDEKKLTNLLKKSLLQEETVWEKTILISKKTQASLLKQPISIKPRKSKINLSSLLFFLIGFSLILGGLFFLFLSQ